MRFDRLRLNGFKSFVDPTDLVIHEGLTGVVGPNGCGKSNLLEALRWVMGENRPTAMRGEGMEDVIFAGTARRSARAHAEVTLTIDNHDRLAPAGMNDADTLDITRRITRDAGSAYRINGKEVRARDVQMLFADASTGAHSPALVRQGQISELINAKPKARRRILEEAAGISGLYQRRHEAELKLNAAEANLTRVDDTLDQLSTQAASLARQARAAARYREIGAALRRAEGVLLYRRWAEAEQVKAATAEALREAIRTAGEAEAQARRAIAGREEAEAKLPPLREEEQVASAILSRATIEREALDEAEARASQAIQTLLARIAQLDRDIERESALNRDAGEVVDRLEWEKRELDKAGQGHDDRLAIASEAADEAAEALREVEAKLAELTDESARLAARHHSAERLAHDLRQMLDRATRAAAEAGTLAVMVGAAPEVFEAVKPLIATFASDIALCGPVGCGQVLKILNNMVLFETVVAVSEAKAIGEKAGVDPNVLFDTLSKGSADSFALRNHGMKAVLPGEFPERAFSVLYARKDLKYALQLARDAGVDARGAAVVDAWFQQAIDSGLGEKYHPVISRLIAGQR